MQNRTAIWAFAILLTLACLYQLSFTWVTSSVEGDAEEYAENYVDSVETSGTILDATAKDTLFQKQESDYLLGQNNQPVYPLLDHTYKYCKTQEINKGLDLQGGMNVTLEVSLVDLIVALSKENKDEKFNEAIRVARAKQENAQEDFVTSFGEAWEEVNPGGKLASIFHNRDNEETFPANATNEEILATISKEAADAISRTEQVLRKRIDNLGVVQPKIQRLESGRILVELPGVRDKKRVRKILQAAAKLEFWETFENQEVYPTLEAINKQIADELKAEAGLAEEKSGSLSGLDSTDVAEDTVIEEPVDTSEVEEKNLIDDLLSGTQVDSLDTTGTNLLNQEPTAEDTKRDNPFFSIFSPNISQQDGKYFPGQGPSVGFCLKKDTSLVNKYLRRPTVKSLLPDGLMFRWEARTIESDNGQELLRLIALKADRDGKPKLEGDKVVNARVATDPLGNAEVQLIMDGEGAESWRRLTGANVGKSVAIVLDDMVYSYPTVQSEISGGVSSISGIGEVQEAEDLASVLKAGKLDAPTNIIQEAVVGPSLGEEAIQSGLFSFLIALAIILGYMFFYYNRAGLVANVALLANLFFVMGVLASLGATLTLPGIAGIVLTIGMSVDANVLIYERIREELREGKGLRLAVVDGYKMAYSSIIDANITTLLTGIILYIFGSGPIKGFATTLIIGIMTSLFSAIFITRLIFEYQLDKKRVITFANSMTQNAFKSVSFSFVARRKMFYMISGIVIVAGFASFAIRGFDQGVDFTGGRTYVVRYDQPADVQAITKSLGDIFVVDGNRQEPEVKTFGTNNQVMITTKYRIDEQGATIDNEIDSLVYVGSQGFYQGGISQIDFIEGQGGTAEAAVGLMSSQKVGPTIADDIKQAAVWAVLFALIIIFLYIVFRFRKWQFGLGALVAMFHDVVVVLALFSIFWGRLPFSMEIDQAFIAAILTVVGYSINDTVVVFDRIREHLGLYKRKELSEILDGALNSTLSRTFNTSISTFFVLLMIFIFGGEVIRGFVFALMIGVIVGTYSSLCVATPIVLDLDNRKGEGSGVKAPKQKKAVVS